MKALKSLQRWFRFAIVFSRRPFWQGCGDSNPEPTVLATAALPIRATPLRSSDLSFLVGRVLAARPAELRDLELLLVRLLVLRRRVVAPLAVGADQADELSRHACYSASMVREKERSPLSQLVGRGRRNSNAGGHAPCGREERFARPP